MQIFLCLKELESMVSKEENRLSPSLENGELDNMTLRFIPSEQVETLVSIGCIGDIECETKPLDISNGFDSTLIYRKKLPFGSYKISLLFLEKSVNSIEPLCRTTQLVTIVNVLQ
jgi:hypothetical protein